ncbi:MAG: hypothetical protein LBB84_07750 [Tannerellaceae bacterium]|jgi:hypothetical protein|nr:hypothetical protein [Tannerellaceae bacterium]
MKTKHFFAVVVITLGGIVSFLSCSQDNDLTGGGPNLHFDKNDLTFESTAGSDVIQILDFENDPNSDHLWGVRSVQITANGEFSEFANTFVIETDGKGSSWNVFVNPFVGEGFSIERKGADLHIQLSENVGSERKLLIGIEACARGDGELRVIQKGK